MRREELVELHYIAPIVNVESILRLGLLSHWRAESVPHESVAMQEIQDRRSRVTVPGGRPLHHYVNLYICARNPMLYVRKDVHRRLTVLKVSQQVLDLAGVAVADRNASSDYVRFASAPDGLRLVDRELVFAEYWTHPDDPLMAL